MSKNRFYLVLVLAFIIIIIAIQGLFLGLQKNYASNLNITVESALRNGNKLDEPYYLSQVVEDLEHLGLLKCAVLGQEAHQTPYHNSKYRYSEEACAPSFFNLAGRKNVTELQAINGTRWRLEYVSNNPKIFYYLLWLTRGLGLVIAFALIELALLYHKKQLIELEQKKKEAELLSQFAAQVSHDIRSPLAALEMAVKELEEDPMEAKLMIQNVSERIRGIATNLLEKNKGTQSVEKIIYSDFELVGLIEKLMKEKAALFKEKTSVRFIFESHLKNSQVMLFGSELEFSRLLSNLINNSVEALENGGEVKLALRQEDENLELVVSDNGCGIPRELLLKIGEKGQTFGKKEGNGLGVYHAKSLIHELEGEFSIESEVGMGTKVRMKLPYKRIQEKEGELFEYVYIEDDSILRKGWERYAKKKKIQLLTLERVKDFDQYLSRIDKEKTKIYIDSDLGKEQMKGEEFAKILYAKGFKQLYIASGHAPIKFAHLPWLKYADKDCPFEDEP